MINIKTEKEIEIMKDGGRILAGVLDQLVSVIKPGMTELELDKLAESLIIQKGAESGFKKVPGYVYTLCLSTNDVVVHGIPKDYKFKEEDIVGIDCGVYYKGFNTDMAKTVRIMLASRRSGNYELRIKNDEVDKFLDTGKRALEEAIKVAIPGNRIGDISKKIQDIVEKVAGYSVVRTLVGHGVGKKLHEEPEVPGFLDKKIENTPLLKIGMTIAIEVIYNMGKSAVMYGDDGWTIKTKDGSLSGMFEKTIVITENGPLELTI